LVQYFSVPHRFLQEWMYSSGVQRNGTGMEGIGQEWKRNGRNGTGMAGMGQEWKEWKRNETGMEGIRQEWKE